MLARSGTGNSGWRWWLALALLFALVSGIRRLGYRRGWLAPIAPDCRSSWWATATSRWGNSKTPVVVWLVEQLQARGWRPGVVSRGYGGKAPIIPIGSDAPAPRRSGDEPVLIARRCRLPVAVAPDEPMLCGCWSKAARWISSVTDDGLQHYALARDIELVVVDGARRFGNGCLLPMGPLREPTTRLKRWTPSSATAANRPWRVRHAPGAGYPAPGVRRCASHGPSRRAGGCPGGHRPSPRFFATLTALGLSWCRCVGYGDHQAFDAAELLARFGQRPC